MCIFGDVERIFHISLSCGGFTYPFDGWILVATHVDDIVVALILDGSCRIKRLGPGIRGLEIIARSGFIAKAPDDDGRIIDTAVDHLHHTGYMGRPPFDGMGEALLTIIVFMAFHIGFRFQPDAVAVAEEVPVGVIRIVSCPYMIDVGAFHHHHVLVHLLSCDGMSTLGIGLMAVHAFELQRLSVDVEITTGLSELIFRSRRVLDFHCAETSLHGDVFHGLTFLVTDTGNQGIYIRLLGSPWLGIFQPDLHVDGSLITPILIRWPCFHFFPADTFESEGCRCCLGCDDVVGITI